jgi:hypothetical protein
LVALAEGVVEVFRQAANFDAVEVRELCLFERQAMLLGRPHGDDALEIAERTHRIAGFGVCTAE